MDETFEFVEENLDAMAAALMPKVEEALKKQIPMKPVSGKDCEGIDYIACPECFGILADKDWKAHWCPDCGQKIDWGDDE